MKKTLLALAAIAASSAAFAQSSVTLYGVVDASLESVRGDKTVTRVSSDNLSSSRFGLKGSEDLGGGTRANFALEAALKTDTGAADATFWSRQAWLGLSGNLGDLRLGRTDSLIGEVAGNVLSAQPYDDLKLLNTRAGNAQRRTNNSITYILPSFGSGLTTSFQYSTGTGSPAGEVPGTSEGKSIGVSIKYAAGPLSAGVAYLSLKDEVAGDAVKSNANATLAYAGYDFGAAKVTAYYNAETAPLGGPGDRRLSVVGAKVAVPFSPEFTLIAGLSTARNTEGRAAGDDNVQVATIKGIYSLSKRTAVYGLFTNVNNGSATNFNVGAAASDDRTTRGFAVGVRHSF